MKKTMYTKKPGNILFKLLITLALVALGGWLLYFNWLQRPIHYRTYDFSIEEAQRLRPFARAQYAQGLHAWFQNDPEAAAGFFRQAVIQDPFFMDAWLKLAEAEATMGHTAISRDILMFASGLTEGVSRWKWPQILLARELGMDDILYRNTNFLLSRRLLTQDALQLLHIQFGGDVTAVMTVLDADNLVMYLDWLMRWGMTDNTLAVWQEVRKNGKPDPEFGLRYAHYLLSKKRVSESISIWQEYRRLNGITNAGFETEITQRGFDWRHWDDKDGNWSIERVNRGAQEGKYALRISFAGRQNIAFQNLYQIIPVTALKRLRLSYAWKSQGITTDQGPFIEIVGYDQKGLAQSGSMITGTHKWREDTIEFRPPAGCRAVLVRVRRRPSHRFDSKIKGSFWLDNFHLEILDSGKKQVLSDKFL
jgi:hypothetical protein